MRAEKLGEEFGGEFVVLGIGGFGGEGDGALAQCADELTFILACFFNVGGARPGSQTLPNS